jgi:hypothetical protein
VKSIATTVWILGATAAGVAALLASTPFESGQHLLERLLGQGPAWAQVRRLYTDPATQEVSHGENPSRSLGLLRENWSSTPGERIVFVGNSQMFAMSLAPGEPAPEGAEKTYPDLVAENYSGSARCYRLAAPGMSYTEALWYATLLTHSPKLRPTAMVLQLNYQSFWNGGIRDGMLEMLDEPEFAAAIQDLATANQPYSDDLADALRRYARRKEQREAAVKAEQAKVELAGPVLANRLESSVRSVLESSPLWQERVRHRGGFFDLLYSSRIYLLHVNPTTARSITGTRLWRSQASLKAIAEMSRAAGIRLFVFNAPVNPNVSLYQTAADLERYRGILDDLKTEYQVPVSDLEHAIPAPLWGTWMNGPDPLHLGRQAHRRMAQLMVQFLDSGLQRQGGE